MFEGERIPVRSLVEFIMRSGDLDNRIAAAPEQAMREGSRMHRKLQQAQGEGYRAEVALKVSCALDETTSVIVEGRADGIYEGRIPGKGWFSEKDLSQGIQAELFMDADRPPYPIIDEIKTTYRRLQNMEAPEGVHLAQAKCYAYMVLAREAEDYTRVGVRMTYCNLDTEQIRYYFEEYTWDEIRDWFDGLIFEYSKWAALTAKWKADRTASIKGLPFPFQYREGQKELCENVYRTIVHGRKLFLEAPTGTGKTIAAVYPSIMAMGEGKTGRIFYLTARTITRTVAEEAVGLLREEGLRLKSISLTAKEKVCVVGKPQCNPDKCPRAKGHFDRINTAIFELLTETDNYSREAILACAEKHQVCPFELSLDMSLFADMIVCDYNYVFDPHVYLRRFFGDGDVSTDAVFLIDEAHNLVDRGRNMYSAELDRSQWLAFRKKIKDVWPELEKKLTKTIRKLLVLKRECAERPEPEERWEFGDSRGSAQRRAYGDCRVFDNADEIAQAVYEVQEEIAKILENERHRDPARHRGMKAELREAREKLQEELLEFYFEVRHFTLIYELFDDHYVCYGQLHEEKDLVLHLYCVDPSQNLGQCMDRGRASVLFSATLLPIQYFKSLLGGGEEDYEIYAHSVFHPGHQGLFILSDVTSRYAKRGADQYRRIAAGIHAVTQERFGNYMVFFPSYTFLRAVKESYEEMFPDAKARIAAQSSRMSEPEREAFLMQFRGTAREEAGGGLDGKVENGVSGNVDNSGAGATAGSDAEECLLGFCVLGGIFSEGIDLKEDRLIGALIVGTGVPQVCSEREILKDYFDAREENGYDYAYRFPGMNKVLQAAGRVIRTADDIGLVALLDDRFLQYPNRRLFPREWQSAVVTDTENVGRSVSRFWDEWL